MNKSPLKFFFLVFAISIPFWIVGAFTEQLSKMLPINLPVSALMFVCPLTAALILVRNEKNSGSSIKELLKRAFDYERIKNKIWYIPIILFMPSVMVLSYWLMRLLGISLPDSYTPMGLIPVLFFVFLIAAIGEEIGWTGYITDPLQARFGALGASIILGTIWAIWHVLPWSQVHPNAEWILWHSAATIAMRLIIVWLYNNTGKSVFSAVLFHAMINVSEFAFPNYGSHYNPFVTFLILAITASVVVFLWGAKTLAHYRYARLITQVRNE